MNMIKLKFPADSNFIFEFKFIIIYGFSQKFGICKLGVAHLL